MFNNKDDKLNKNIYPEEGHKKPVLIWSNSQFNKKTYENLFYKKTFDKYVPVREKLVNENKNSNSNVLLKNIFLQEHYIPKIIPKIYPNLEWVFYQQDLHVIII